MPHIWQSIFSLLWAERCRRSTALQQTQERRGLPSWPSIGKQIASWISAQKQCHEFYLVIPLPLIMIILPPTSRWSKKSTAMQADVLLEFEFSAAMVLKERLLLRVLWFENERNESWAHVKSPRRRTTIWCTNDLLVVCQYWKGKCVRHEKGAEKCVELHSSVGTQS